MIVEDVSNYNGPNISCNNYNDGFIELTTTGGYLPYNYNWSGPNNFLSNDEDINALSAGLYECVVIDNLGCEKTISILIEEPNPIELEVINVNDLNCFNNAHINFNATGGTGILEGVINTNWGEDTTFISNLNNEWYFEYENFDQWNGEINITVMDINDCAISSNNISVTTWDNPLSVFEISTFNTSVLDPIFFTDYSIGEIPIINWTWNFGDGNVSNNPNPTHIYEEEGQYTVCLKIEDLNGCESEICKIINIYSNSYAYIPNIFTVNDDNINERFTPIITGLIPDSYKMDIYDRWGKLLFSSKNHLEGWDGTYENRRVNEGIFSYMIQFLTISGEEKKYIGKVTLAK